MKDTEMDIPGFSLPHENKADTNDKSIKKTKSKKCGGGFQSMGLSYPVLSGITKRGYKLPTPIQRKTIPLILEGRDVVAMAKTGSGKTACFLIPMFEKLKRREPNTGARALILSPTRELAIQTFKFIKEIGKFLDLKTVLVLGGDPMNAQFSSMHACPDIIVATPGRFLHLCVEMDLKLGSVGYVVCDEADRLFEMGFGEQLNEILHRLPESKQMIMFSATLPKLLVDFAKAGLSDPVLIRLDVDTKLPEELVLKFLYCRSDERYTSLVALLKYVIPTDGQTVVFAGTQHHVELISHILNEVGISNTMVYSSLDPSARKINTAKFVHKKVSVLIVTDVAARGIDIPSLDYVINLHFPGKPKLFIHRVGRCARAGRHGTAYSIFSTEDQAHLLDLHLFLNRTFDVNDCKSIGTIPQDILEEEHHYILDILKNPNISGIYKTSENAYKKYLSSRPIASAESNKRVKLIKFFMIKHLEDFLNSSVLANKNQSEENEKSVGDGHIKIENEKGNMKLLQIKQDILLKMKNFKPHGTIFELNPRKKSVPLEVMKQKRLVHSDVIDKFRQKLENMEKEDEEKNDLIQLKSEEECSDTEINNTFGKIITSKKRKNMENLYKSKSKKKKEFKDEEYYIPYQSADKHTEDGLAINSFEKDAQNAEFSVVQEKNQGIKHRPGLKKWDRIKKKMVSVQDPREGKIRTESGMWIPATYKTGRYNDWKEKTKIEEQIQREEGDDTANLTHEKKYPISRWARHNAKVEAKKRMGMNGMDNELKNPEQIVKRRLRLEFVKKREQENRIKKAQNRKKHMRKMKKKTSKK